MNKDLAAYYKERAREYDRVYQIPAEQQDLAAATKIFHQLFSNRSVLEIACGTGYWTGQISKTAKSILATDINETVIEIAKTRTSPANVQFEVVDMFALSPGQKFDALFGGFIWSHILLQDLDDFLLKIKTFLYPGATLAFIDSKQVRNGVHDTKSIAKTDEQGNTFQARKLDNGTTHLVLKNFPTPEFLTQKLSAIATRINHTDLEHYWIVTGTLIS